MMRTKRGALDSTVQTHLRTKARVRVCVCVRCGGGRGALLVKARDALQPPPLLVLGTQAGRPRELGWPSGSALGTTVSAVSL